jgi:hypothetical protein
MTRRETLLSHGESPYFTRLLEAGGDDIAVAGAQHDSEGRLFIDRCLVMFGYILSHLRGREFGSEQFARQGEKRPN